MISIRLIHMGLAIATVTVFPCAAPAIVLSDRNQNHVITPGEPLYGLNLDGVAAIGSGTPGASSLADIIVFQCSGALISDRH